MGSEIELSWLKNLHDAEKFLPVPQRVVTRREAALCSGSVCLALTEVVVCQLQTELPEI